MKSLQKNHAAAINRLHSEISSAARTCLEKAIQLGGLLAEQKESVGHGNWIEWLGENTQISESTAKRYMACFNNRAMLKSVNVSDLNGAYRLLSAPKTPSAGAQKPRQAPRKPAPHASEPPPVENAQEAPQPAPEAPREESKGEWRAYIRTMAESVWAKLKSEGNATGSAQRAIEIALAYLAANPR